jgi:hypothetical protein
MTAQNNFSFSQLVEWGVMERYSNTLATSMYAIPYTKFNSNTEAGMSRTIRYPVIQKGSDGISYDPANVQSIYQRVRNITLGAGNNVTFNVSWDQMTFEDAANSQEEFSNRYLLPNASAMGQLVNKKTLVEMAIYFSDTIGNPSQPLNGLTTMADVDSQFSNMGLAHFTNRYFQLSPNSTKGIQVPYSTYFNQGFNTSILEKDTTTFDKAYSGIKNYVDQSFVRITNGTFSAAGNVTVSVAPPVDEDINQPYSTVTLAGFNLTQTNVIRALNRVTFADATTPSDAVYAVNPDNFEEYGLAKTFVVLDDTDSDGSGNAEINIFPPVVSSTIDPYQNVTRNILVGDKVTLLGGANAKYTLNFAFVDQGLLFANPPISTNPPSSPNSSMGGFSYQQVMSQKIPNSLMTLSFNLSSAGNHPMFSNTMSSRTITGVAAFNGYGFGVASSF